MPKGAPAWAHAALTRTPFVVVRHAPSEAGTIPVGVRGHARNERFGFHLARETIARRVTPEQLVSERAWTYSSAAFPAIVQLPFVEAALSPTGYAWGPAGSVAFELATGCPTVTSDSDLDLIVRLPERVSPDEIARLHASLRSAVVRIDVRVEVPGGFASLSELAAARPTVLLRTAAGPRMVRDPWLGHAKNASRR